MSPEDRLRYRAHLRRTLRVGGTGDCRHVGADRPRSRSGLPVMRDPPEMLAEELGTDLSLVEAVRHTHTTPWGATQSFQYSRLRRTA